MKNTFDTIEVQPINFTALIADVIVQGREKKIISDDEIFDVRGKLGIIKQPKMAVLDDDAVGGELANENDEFQIHLYINNIKDHSFDMFPKCHIKVTVAKIERHLGESVSLKEFMGRRYRYNGRISGNEQSWLQYFNG